MRPEDHRPQRRVQPVGPGHQVEAPPVAAREGHVDPVGVLGESPPWSSARKVSSTCPSASTVCAPAV